MSATMPPTNEVSIETNILSFVSISYTNELYAVST